MSFIMFPGLSRVSRVSELPIQVAFTSQPLVWFWQGKSHGHNQKGVRFVWLTAQPAGLFPLPNLSRTLLQDEVVKRGSRAIPKPNSAEITAPEL